MDSSWIRRFCARRPIRIPFAYDTKAKRMPSASFTRSNINCPYGFSKAFAVNPERGGTPVTLNDFNSLGYMGTFASFLHQIGYRPTYDVRVADQIGGYPKGTILTDFSEAFNDTASATSIVREVVSLQDNNTKNFVYDEETNPEPYKIGEADENGVVWWKFVEDETEYSMMAPDFTGMKLIASMEDISSEANGAFTYTSNYNGWMMIVITAKTGYASGATPSEEKINAVYHYGLSSELEDWNGRIGPGISSYRIYTTLFGPFYSSVVATNVGIKHQIKCYIEDVDNPLAIKLFKLGIYQRPSE